MRAINKKAAIDEQPYHKKKPDSLNLALIIDAMSKLIFIYFLVLSVTASAEGVNVLQAGTLVATQDVKAEGVLRQATEALVSKNTGLSVEYLQNNGVITADFSSVILHHYFEQSISRNAAKPYWLRVVADENKLMETLAAHELPIWPKRRAPVYVWLVSETQDGVIQHEPNGSTAHYWLSQWLENKGVPAVFHQVSEEDLLDFAPEDVKNLNPDLIDYVHQVQQQKQLLLVYLKDTGRGYSYRMAVAVEGQELVMKHRQFVDLSTGFSYLSEFIQSHQAADRQIFANEMAKRTVSVQINNIVNADQMNVVVNYLNGQTLIDHWQVTALKNQVLTLRLEISVLPETFVRFVDNESVLTYLPLDAAQHLIFSANLQ